MTTTVQQAIAAVMGELPSIGKDDRSPEGYSYRGIEAVTKQVQPLFAKHGVVIAPRATITDVRPSPAMKDGWSDVFMSVEWVITGPDGSTITAQTTGIGRDRADKGANKAQTQAYKYLLLHLLCIADGKDDVDSHTYEQDRQEQRPPERTAQPGFLDADDEKSQHDDLASTIKASGPDVVAHMKTWREDRKLPWPMARTDLEAMWAELASVQQPPAGDPPPPDEETPAARNAKERKERERAAAQRAREQLHPEGADA